ncbi:hypothetical protein PInf_014551 [Phytophthora infestans]|nr:hypothetical protein PInf_014551 [Phytophthora infestans]
MKSNSRIGCPIAPELIDAIPVVVADSGSEESLAMMVQQSKVVGPWWALQALRVNCWSRFVLRRRALLRPNGEIVWIEEMTAKYAAIAAKTERYWSIAAIESIPSDVTTFLVADRIQKKFNSATSTLCRYGDVDEQQLLASRNPFFLTDEKTIAEKQQAGLRRAPGQGPSEESMLQGYFVAEAAGYTDDGKLAVKAKTVGSGDPGYRLTSRLISECAFCLAKDEFGDAKSLKGGFYTPASAFGHKLADRLQTKKFITFELKDMA